MSEPASSEVGLEPGDVAAAGLPEPEAVTPVRFFVTVVTLTVKGFAALRLRFKLEDEDDEPKKSTYGVAVSLGTGRTVGT